MFLIPLASVFFKKSTKINILKTSHFKGDSIILNRKQNPSNELLADHNVSCASSRNCLQLPIEGTPPENIFLRIF